MISFSIQSFGCRVNQAEAFAWVSKLQKNGFVYEKDPSQTDIILVNTCTLTARADRDVRKFLSRISRDNPSARVVLTGCYTERHAEEVRQHPQVWQVLRNREKEGLAERILAEFGPQAGTSSALYRSRALIKIQDGCDFRCTFCIIPFVRGRSVSVPPDKILAQVRDLVQRGYREIVLTGIHINSYGRDREPTCSLLDLIKQIERIEGLGRVRLSSLDPRFLDSDFVDHVAANPRICPHFHISLQHASNAVLRKMGRDIGQDEYRRILREIREKNPDASLGADLIVGFPGETDEDFKVLLDFCERAPLSYFHVFSYSPRPDTPASRSPQVKEHIKKERARLLQTLTERKRASFQRRFIGRKTEGVVIKRSRDGAEILTPHYLKVWVPECPQRESEDVQVQITSVSGRSLVGQVIDHEKDHPSPS